ncbi:MAG TPA: hydrogenase 4 subunit F [Dehalococcoidia bacterium]|nr:hydrogenase 4 subunit F [Dehalococcoidia bacterium]
MIVLAVCGLIVLPSLAAIGLLVFRLREGAPQITLAVVSTMMVAALAIGWRVVERGPQLAAGDWVYIDQLGVVVLVLIALVGVCAALNSLSYIRHDVDRGELRPQDVSRYYAFFLIFMATMVTVPVVNNLGLMWVAIEATTIVSVLLVSIYRHGRSLEAAWKYLVLASVGIAIALFGTMMTYYAASTALGESSSALNWTALRAGSVHLDPEVMRLAFVFIVIGYGTKVGLAPMHTWLPDAHSQAPSPVSGLLSGVLLNCALYAVLRFKILTSESAGPGYTDNILIAFGLFSIVLAVPFLIVQHDIKRLLGYHSVEHMGIIVLAVGIGGRTALYAAMLHMVAHSLTKSSLFFAAGAAVQTFSSRSMHRMKGLVKVAPVPGAALILGAFALAGLPPFAMFNSEYGLVAGAFSGGQAVIGVAGILFITFAAASLLYHVVGTAYGEPRPTIKRQTNSSALMLSVIAPLVILLWISVAPPQRFEQTMEDAVTIVEGH